MPGTFRPIQTVPWASGPDEAVTHTRDHEDGETILVRYRLGGGITVFKAKVNTTTFQRAANAA